MVWRRFRLMWLNEISRSQKFSLWFCRKPSLTFPDTISENKIIFHSFKAPDFLSIYIPNTQRAIMSHLFGFAHKFDAFRRVFFFPSIFSSIYANRAIDKHKAAHASVCLCAEQCCQIVPENIDISTTKNGKRQFCSRKNVQLLLSKTFIDRCKRRRISKIFLYIHQPKFAQIKLWMKFTTFFFLF